MTLNQVLDDPKIEVVKVTVSLKSKIEGNKYPPDPKETLIVAGEVLDRACKSSGCGPYDANIFKNLAYMAVAGSRDFVRSILSDKMVAYAILYNELEVI